MLKEQIEYLRKNVIIESPHRYIFPSATKRSVSHIVDLEDNFPAGECSCEHYQYKIKKMIDLRVIKKNSLDSNCKHLRVAKDLFYEMTIKAYVEQRNKNQTN